MNLTVHDAAFAELVAVLMADGSLSSLVRQWRRWSDDPDDPGPIPIVPEHCPIIRLTPVSSGSAAVRVAGDGLLQHYELPMGVEVETFVAGEPARGVHRKQTLDLSALIYGALWPDDRARRAAIDARFRTVGVSDVVLRRPILPVAFDESFAVSSGLIELSQSAIM
jgi:hypothetical protein